MAWEPLAERLPSLPLILCGPMPRRVEPRSVTVWVALRAPRRVTLCVYERDEYGGLRLRCQGTRHTVRLGDALHIAAVTARVAEDAVPLASATLYYYNLFFADTVEDASSRAARGVLSHTEQLPSLTTPGVLVADPTAASEVERLVYSGHPLPAVVLPADELAAVRLLHGSCRKPHGTGHDALYALDLVLASSASDTRERPQQLLFTGDQIYADDVATATLYTIIDLGQTLFAGNAPEILPRVERPSSALAPTTRAHAMLDLAHFTTGTASNHCMSYADYCGLYLLMWSAVLWPSELPTLEEIWAAYPRARPSDGRELRRLHAIDAIQRASIEDFLRTLPNVRRGLANIATYMVFDDHDISDDWYLDGAWCANVLASPLGWRVVRNGLFAFAFFQAWGNDPNGESSLGGELGSSFLDAVDGWRGDEYDAAAATINTRLGMPASFSGVGELQHPPGSLTWHFRVETPRYTLLANDERTRRIYRAPKACPGRLSPGAIAEQIVAPGAELTVMIAQTPVLGVELVERVQTMALNNYSFDREAWSLDRITYQQLLRALEPLQRVVILSGDVHYGFGASMQFWDETTQPPRSATYVNFISSSLKNETGGTQKALLTVAYPEIFYLLSRGRLPVLELFAWTLYPGDRRVLREALEGIRKRALHPWWALSHLMEALHSPEALVLPARGWPPGTFADCPPDRRYRVRYLRDACLEGQTSEVTAKAKAALPKELAKIRAAHVSPAEVMTTLNALEARGELPLGAELIERVLDAVRGLVRAGVQVERHVARRLLDFIVEHRNLWNQAWQKDLHIVGDTNLGEIRFDPATAEAIQRLWWWYPTSADTPTPATEYRWPLVPPRPAEAPPLPPREAKAAPKSAPKSAPRSSGSRKVESMRSP